jgi:hypothetical protein
MDERRDMRSREDSPKLSGDDHKTQTSQQRHKEITAKNNGCKLH